MRLAEEVSQLLNSAESNLTVLHQELAQRSLLKIKQNLFINDIETTLSQIQKSSRELKTSLKFAASQPKVATSLRSDWSNFSPLNFNPPQGQKQSIIHCEVGDPTTEIVSNVVSSQLSAASYQLLADGCQLSADKQFSELKTAVSQSSHMMKDNAGSDWDCISPTGTSEILNRIDEALVGVLQIQFEQLTTPNQTKLPNSGNFFSLHKFIHNKLK